MRTYILPAFLLFVLLASTVSYGQAEIRFSKAEITTNETFQIALVSNQRAQNITPFPAIPGFRKSDLSRSETRQSANGTLSYTFTIIQVYVPEKAGTFKIQPFEMKVNGKKVVSQGGQVKVSQPNKDPFAVFFDQNMSSVADASIKSFFAFTVSKDEVYVGEGFKASLAFYIHISENNLINFDNATYGIQSTEIAKKLRPTSCWEEKLDPRLLFKQRVIIDNELYTKHFIGQSYLFPMNQDTIVFPSVSLRMEKLKVQRFGNIPRLKHDGYKTFQTKPVTVKVKPLPPHPLKDKVNVGQYSLVEDVDTTQAFKTGNSFMYKLWILGNGNITSLKEMAPSKNKGMNFSLSETDQQIIHTIDTIYGTRNFLYHVEPREPGIQPLKKYIEWVYFNPQTEKYDTLQSKLAIEVTGKPIKTQSIANNTDADSFYANLNDIDNQLGTGQYFDWQKTAFNLLVLFLLLAVLALNYRKKGKQEVKKPENTNPFL